MDIGFLICRYFFLKKFCRYISFNMSKFACKGKRAVLVSIHNVGNFFIDSVVSSTVFSRLKFCYCILIWFSNCSGQFVCICLLRTDEVLLYCPKSYFCLWWTIKFSLNPKAFLFLSLFFENWCYPLGILFCSNGMFNIKWRPMVWTASHPSRFELLCQSWYPIYKGDTCSMLLIHFPSFLCTLRWFLLMPEPFDPVMWV